MYYKHIIVSWLVSDELVFVNLFNSEKKTETKKRKKCSHNGFLITDYLSYFKKLSAD